PTYFFWHCPQVTCASRTDFAPHPLTPVRLVKILATQAVLPLNPRAIVDHRLALFLSRFLRHVCIFSFVFHQYTAPNPTGRGSYISPVRTDSLLSSVPATHATGSSSPTAIETASGPSFFPAGQSSSWLLYSGKTLWWVI